MKSVRFLVACLVLSVCGLAEAALFNGQGQYQADQYGYYYIVTGGKFPTGTAPNGSRASGGTFRYLTDDPAWGYSIDTWHKDGWFSDNAGFALTLKNAGSVVYDNNGLEDGSYGDYYDAGGSHGIHGLYRGYSMSNNFDFIYAGYFKLEQTTTIDTLIGYFDANGSSTDPVPFDPNSPSIAYQMNIWSNVAGDLLPKNTGSFNGDVFSSDTVSGVFSVSNTGVNRVMPDASLDPIWRTTLTLDTPITLGPGEYWFNHNAVITPEPASLIIWSVVGGLGLIAARLRRRRAA